MTSLLLTTALLWLLSPTPLTPDVSGRLFATGAAPRSLDFESVFRTRAPLRKGHWTGIVLRESGTAGGDVATLAELAQQRGASGPPDHFVIGNGRGMADGEVQFTSRWMDQRPTDSLVLEGVADATLICVCLVGNHREQPPTDAQMRRLRVLVEILRERLALTENCVTGPQGLLEELAALEGSDR